jgi:hypothetical protein
LRQSVQIVDLQTHRSCARASNTIEHAYHVGIWKRARGLDEYSLFYPHLFRKVGSIAELIAVGMVLQTLLK